MLPVYRLTKILRTAAFRCALVCAVMTVLFVSAARAVPITYTGFTITDGQLGSWKFHNARVFLTFASDTSYVQALTINQGISIAYNPTGVARITIIEGRKTVKAIFNPDQIFVSYDMTNGGVGFGSFAPDGSFQPAYPLGVAGGTAQGPAAVGFDLGASAEELALSADLMHDTGLSGRGWVCVSFPDPTCPAPTVPLMTNKGPLFLFQPYQVIQPTVGMVLNAGLFFADTTHPHRGLPDSLFAPSIHVSSGPITYHVFLVSDVSIGGQLFTNAKIHLFFRSNTSAVRPLSGSSHAYVNEDGIAHVEITKGERTISAKFDAHQIYVYFDPSAAPEVGSVGFGSYSGGRGYPVTLTQCSCDFPQLVGAVSDIITNAAPAASYTPQTASLMTDLTNETVLADFASSCPAFDPATSYCSNLTSPPKLTTNAGDFYLYEPYTQAKNSLPFSNNWGIFWSTFNPREEFREEFRDESRDESREQSRDE